MQKIHVLEIKAPHGGYIYPVVIEGDDEMLLIDAGYPGQLGTFKEAFVKAGLSIDQLTHILITHHDYDHMGALGEMVNEIRNLKVITSSEQAPYVEGIKKSLRLQQAELIFDELPEAEKQSAIAFEEALKSVAFAKVDRIVEHSQMLDIAGGIQVIMTPGHMPGHLSVYVDLSKTLVTGDAMVAENGTLLVANPQYTLDMPKALDSIVKLSELNLERVICYHGGEVSSNVSKKMAEIKASILGNEGQ